MEYSPIELKDRIRGILKARGITNREPWLVSLGISKNTLDNANKSMPKADTLAVMADALDLSMDFLMGRSSAGISPAEQQFLDLFPACSGRQNGLNFLTNSSQCGIL